MEKENKELDLFDLIGKMLEIAKKWLASIGDAILWLIRFHFKNSILLIAFILVGASLGYYAYMPQNRKMNAEFGIQINGPASFQVYDIVKALGQSIDVDNDNIAFADTLGVTKEIAKPLRKIEPFYYIDLNNNWTIDYVDYDNSFKEDTMSIRKRNFLCIRFETKGNANYNAIQEGIVEYLKVHPYINREGNERIKVLQQDIAKLESEIVILDSLRQSEYKSKTYSYSFDKISLNATRQTFHDQILDLNKRKSNLQEQLDLQKDVITIYSRVTTRAIQTDFYLFESRIVVLYILGLMLAFFLSYRKKIMTIIKEKR